MLGDSAQAAIRSRFPIYRSRIFFNSCSQGAYSDAVESALQEYTRTWIEFGSPWDLWMAEYEKARQAFARLIGAEADEVAIAASVSGALNSVASALDFNRRHKVVMGEFEFPTMGHVWLAQERRGAKVQFLPADGNTLPASRYREAIDGDTLIVPITHVCFMNGFRSHVKDIVRAAREAGAYALLDDYQDCGTRPIDVKELDLDFYTAGTLKYLCGPAGVAFLYVRKEISQQFQPTASGWFAQANPFSFNPKLFELAPNARRFETGTPPVPNIYASLAGVNLLLEIGLDRVRDQVSSLTRLMLDGLRELGVRTKTPADSQGPLVVVQTSDSEGIIAALAKEGIICSTRLDGLRVAFHVYNNREDVDHLLRALKKNMKMLVRSDSKEVIEVGTMGQSLT